MIERWKGDGLVLLPAEPESAVRAAFSKVGSTATADVISMYATLGGMPEMDKEYWRLWSLADIQIENATSTATGVLFSDYLISCWSYRLVPNEDDTSSVFVDYFNDDQCIHVASSLEEFFGKYIEDPFQVLEGPHPGQEPGRDA
ncbi:hypothetical protein [Roseateles sp.]|uniref:hypothetical protein n=1 Tax=Roseateles sp. TaxID=1971397 RepID=UPI00392889F1